MTPGSFLRRAVGQLASGAWRVVNRATREDRSPQRRRLGWPGRTRAGVAITPDTAFRDATVWACVRYLSQTVAALPWRVYQPTAEGHGLWVPRHPVSPLLRLRPNPEWSSFQLRETLTAWALTEGNGYAEIELDQAGRAMWLWPIHPERVCVKRDGDALYYEVRNDGGGMTELAPSQILHVRGFGHGPVGLSVIEYAAESLGWARATEIFGSTFFGNGLNADVMISVKEPLSTDAYDEMLQRLDERHRGPGRAHRPYIVDNAAEFQQLSVEPEKAQFIQTRQHQVEEICRWFGVPPHKVMHLLRATFSNIEHQSIEVVVDSITPWTRRWEQECDFKLFGANRPGFYTKLNLTALLRGDTAARIAYYQGMRNLGVLSADEIRALEEMPPIGKAGGGEKRVMQGQYTTLEKIGEAPPPQAEDDTDDEDVDDDSPMAALANAVAKDAADRRDALMQQRG